MGKLNKPYSLKSQLNYIGFIFSLTMLLLLGCGRQGKRNLSILPVSLTSTENRLVDSYLKYVEKVSTLESLQDVFQLTTKSNSVVDFARIIESKPDLLFYPATLWQMSEFDATKDFQQYAINFTEGIQSADSETCLLNGEVIHGVFLTPYKLNKNKEFLEPIVKMLSRYISKCEHSLALNRGKVSNVNIDLLLENKVLFFATKQTGDPGFRNFALENSSYLYKTYFRNDLRMLSVLKNDFLDEHFESLTNEDFYILAVGMYGFVSMYEETGMIEYLEFSKKIAFLFEKIFDSENYSLNQETKQKVEEKIDLLSRSMVCLGLFNLSVYTEKSFEDISSEIYLKTLRELELKAKEKTNFNSIDMNYSFRLFYYLFEYELQKQNLI